MVDSLQGIGYSLLASSIFMTLLLLYFGYFEYLMWRNSSSSGNKKKRTVNYFVILTLLASVAATCSTWINAICYLTIGLPSFSAGNALNIVDTILNLLGAAGHVYLLVLRTRGLFTTSLQLAKFMKILGFCFTVFLAFNIVVTISSLFPAQLITRNLHVLGIVFADGTIAMSVVLLAIDIASSFVFGRQVYQQHVSKVQLIQDDDTKIIANMGFAISSFSLVTCTLYALSQLLVVTMLNFNWIAYLISADIVVALWIIMKIRVDKLKKPVDSKQDDRTITRSKKYPEFKTSESSMGSGELLLSLKTYEMTLSSSGR
jgi:hypothetical protein